MRKGAALLWVITFVAVTAAIAAMATPYLQNLNDSDRVADSFTTLRAVGTAIVSFQSSVGHFPAKTSMLTTAIRPTIDRNSCWTGNGSAIVNADSTNWITHGPFAAFYIPVGGINTPIGRLRDSIPIRTNKAAMFIEMPGVSMSDAERFKAKVDSNATPAGDTITILHGAVAGFPDTTTIQMRLFIANAFSSC